MSLPAEPHNGVVLEIPIQKQPLRYLFLALYKDNSTLVQTAEDVSAVDPTKSAYADVRHEDLIAFMLVGKGQSYGVNLTDGTFIIGEAPPVRFHPSDARLVNIKLVYYRLADNDITTEFNLRDRTAKITDVTPQRSVYCMGFRAIDANTGKIVERILELD